MGDAKLGQTQARGFAVPRRLQHVFRGQCGSSAVAEGKGVLEELDDLGFGFHVRRTIAVIAQALGELLARERRPDEPVRSSDVLNLDRK
jgi:hypothetical protein